MTLPDAEPPMTPDLDGFVSEFFRVERALRDDAPRSERLWNEQTVNDNASSQLDDLIGSAPDEAWRRILVLIARAPDHEALAYVAAAPFEDFIAAQGDQFADSIVAEASSKPCVSLALDMTWGWTTVPASVRDRLLPLMSPDIRDHWLRRIAEDQPRPKRSAVYAEHGPRAQSASDTRER